MPTRRQRRINELLLEELSLLVPSRLDDPRLVAVAITRVEATQDLGHAKVYYTCAGTDEECAASLDALHQAAGFLRGELAGLGLRRLPQLVFARDRDWESGERVLAILRDLEARDAGDDEDDEPQSGDEDSDPANDR
jgi:ribosome-binding factor A